MAQTWTIFVSGQPTVERAVVHELEYHGSWMEEEYVSVNVRSATPITFQYGDHLYYRGTKFEINYDPNFIKKARSGSYGEGFTYDNIKLYPVSVKLKDIAFKDVVLNDPSAPANTLVYSSLGTFSFFAGSVEDLADRIQANLNRDYNGEWRVYTPYKARSIQRNGNIGAWGEYYNGDGSTIQGKTDINIECQNLSVMDALKMAYTSFDLSFYVTGKVIVIGGKPISADYDFEYGKGNGLYEIERTHDDSQRIVTKLFAYGSDKNLPLNYYANIGKRVKVQIAHKTKREITMGNPELVLWVNKEFTKALRDAFSPTYEVKLTLGHLSARFGVCGNTYTYAEEQDDDTLDHTTEYMTFWALSSDANALAMYNILVSGSQLYVTGVNINEMPADFIETPTSYNYDATLSITKLMLPGFPTQSLFAWVVANGATHINYQTGQARWHGYDAIFSTDKSDPWIKSINAGNIGVREGTVEFDSSSDKEIFPTIEGTGFDEVAWCEQIEDNGHIDKELTFALQPMTVDGSDGDIEWDYGGVSISMKDGYCTGREFEVAEAKLNDNGDWELTMKRKKDDSLGVYFPYKSGSGNLYQIMGRGNHHGQLDGDHFVILGIPLPQSYVENAAAMLLEEALKHLAKVDHQSYTYLPRIDEIEMARQHDRAMASQGTITSIHDTICAGMQMQIDDDDLNVHYSPFIDNITIKENGNNGIPTYDVVLKDEKEMTMQERIQSQIDGGKDAIINSLSPEGEWLSKVSDDTAQGMITFLRGLQVGERFVTGLLGEGGVFRVEDDGTTYIEADKLYIRMKAYFDSVEIREYHHTGGNRIASVAGARCCRVEWIDSQGNVLEKTQANLSSVVKFRCYFMGNDGEDEVRNNWVVGDLAYCHITTVETEQSDNPEAKGLNMRHYWRKVVGRNATGTLTVKGEHWIDLSNVSGEYQSGSDVPVAQDDIIQLGNVNDGDRQGAIIEFVTGADAPSYQIFQHINSFSLNEKNFVNLGYDSQNNTAQAFIGNPDKSTYLWYHNVTVGGQTFPRLEIKANVQFTSPESSYGTQDLNAFISAVTGDINNMHNQIDGQIESWFYDYMPVEEDEGAPANTTPLVTRTVSGQKVPVYPYYDWFIADGGDPTTTPVTQPTSTTERLKHLGDTFYDNTSGYAFRFSNTGTAQSPTFAWVVIQDSAVIKALADAAKAQDTADHKRRAFVLPITIGSTTYNYPYPPYDVGDLWLNAKYPYNYDGATDAENDKYNNDVLRCVTSQGENGSFNINHWVLASKYTDDSALNDFVNNTYAEDLLTIGKQIDKKAETWYQDEDPSDSHSTPHWTDDNANHVGDIWYDTSTNGGNNTYIYRDRGEGHPNRFYWAEQAVPKEVFDEIDGKAAIYVMWGAWDVPSEYPTERILQVKDLLIPHSDIKQREIDGGSSNTVVYKANKVYRCTNVGSLVQPVAVPTFEEIQYTDDSALNDFKANQYVQALTSGTISTDITNASNAAQQAKQAADDAQADADAANTRLNNWADDGKISPTEKTALKQQWEDIKKEYLQICADATRYNVSTTNFDTAYTNANNAFTKYTASTPENITIDADYANIAAYYSARQTILDSIASAAKTYAGGYYSDTVLSAIKTALGSALGATTLIDGGLMLTSMMFLRQLRKSGGVPLDPSVVSNYTTWAGVSGEYNDKTEGQTGWAKGNGIAAWFGGDMVDFEMLNATQQAAGWGTGTNQYRYAKTLFRMDGTGYLAGGNIKWGSDGSGSVAGGNLAWNAAGNITYINGQAVQVNGSDVLTAAALADYLPLSAGSTKALTGDLYISNNKFIKWLDSTNVAKTVLGLNDSNTLTLGYDTASAEYETGIYGNTITFGYGASRTTGIYLNASGNVGIGTGSPSVKLDVNGYTKTTRLYLYKPNSNDTGAVYIEYDSTNSGMHLVGAGFYSDSYVSALGQGSSGGGGGITLNEPLLGINQAGLSAPTTNGSVLVYNNGWKYSNTANIFATGISIAGTASAAGFSATGRDNTYVLLGGGSTSKLKTINGNSIFGDGDITISGGGSNDRLVSVSDPINAQVFQIRIGQVAIGTSAGKAYAGSSSTYNLWSFPDGATVINSNNTANIQSIRYTWDANHFRDFFMSPNNDWILHRQTSGGVAHDWYMVPQYLYVKGSIGLGSSTKPVYIDSNGKLVEANSYPSTLDNIADGTTRKLSDYVTISTAQTISGAKTFANGCWIIAANESNAISSKHWGGETLYNNANNALLSTAAAIRNAIRFKWYNTYWNIGNIRGSNTDTYGFGIALEDTTNNRLIDCLRVTKDGTYVQGNLVWHAGNDGTGSGLDADLLDGQHGSYYAAASSLTDYLTLAGGTLTNKNNVLNIASTNENAWICFSSKISGTSRYRASVGYYANFAFVANEATYARIGVTDAGVPQYWDNAGGGSGHVFDLIHSGNISSYNAGSATKLQTARSLWGNSFDGSADLSGSLHIYSTGSGWNEGIRMHLASNGRCGIVMCGSDNTGASGTSEKTWSMHNHDGVFGIFKNGSTTSASDYLTNNGNWCFKSNVGIGTTNPSYILSVVKAADVWHVMIGTENGKHLRIGGSTINGSVISAFNGSSAAKLLLQRDGGNVGIGTADPAYPLDVVGNAQFGNDSKMKIRLGTTSTAAVLGMVDAGGTSRNVVHLTSRNILYFGGGTGAAGYQTTFRGHKMAFVAGSTTQVDAMFISSAGKVMIGSSSAASYMLHVTGDIYATGGITALSDAREKNVIGNTNLTVEDIAMMKAVNYRWKDGRDNVQHVGSIAQDWQRVLPEVVMRADDEKGTLSLQYGVAALVSSIVTARKVVDHERRIAELERENRELKEKLKIA